MPLKNPCASSTLFRVDKITLRLFITSIFIGVILSGCFIDTSSDDPGPGDAGYWTVEIDPAHQDCALDSNCRLAYVDCSTCECGISINLKYEEYYKDRYEELCRDYIGPVCEIYCPPSTLVCIDGQCEVKPE